MSIPQEKTAFMAKLEKQYADAGFPLICEGTEDAPPGLKLQVQISRCDADAENPLSCIIANNIKQIAWRLDTQLPIGTGSVMADGVSITSDRAYIAVKQPQSNTYKILKFNHDGAWVVNSFDSQDPARLERMWKRVEKGGEGSIVTLKRFRSSQTTEGREARALARAKRDAAKLERGEALPKAKLVPQRGNRKNGISARRATIASLMPTK